MIYIKAPNSDSIDRLYKCWPDISQLVNQVCQNVKVNLVLDDPIYAFDCELYHSDGEVSLLLRLNSNNLEVAGIDAAIIFGVAQITTMESATILKRISKLTKKRSRDLISKYLHHTFYWEATAFSERLITYLSISLVKELSFNKLDLTTQGSLQEPIRSGFQTSSIKRCFKPLVIADNIWRRAGGLDITKTYSQFLDTELLSLLLNIYVDISNNIYNPSKQSIDKLSTNLAEIVMIATYKEVTDLDFPRNNQPDNKLIRLKSEIEDIVRKKEEQGD